MPRLSIVIPCLGSAAEFDDTLVSVLQNRPPRCEVLVVHAQPYDDPYGLKDEVRFIRVSGRPSQVQLANTGLEASRGEIVHLLGCRMIVPEGWAESALEPFETSDVAAVSPLVLDPVHQQVTAAGVNYGLAGSRKIAGQGLELTSRQLRKLKVAGPTLDAGFYRREVLLALGGWQESLGAEVADVDLAQSLAALNLQTVVATSCLIHERTAAPRVGGFSHGRSLERLFWRQASRGSRGLAVSLHLFAVLIDFATRLPKGDALTTLLGRAVGLLHAGSQQCYRDQLQQARAALEGEEPNTLSLDAARDQRSEAALHAGERRRAA